MFESMRKDALAGLEALGKSTGLRQRVMAHIVAATSSENPTVASSNQKLKELWESIQAGSAHSGADSVGGGSQTSGEDSIAGADSLASLNDNSMAKKAGRDDGAKVDGALSLKDLRECIPKSVRVGSSGAVHKMVLVKDGTAVAVKFVPLCLVQAERNQLIKEVSESYSCGLPFSDPLRASSRSHVIGFHGAFYDAPSRRLGIVMDYVNGGNLEEVYKASAIKGGKGGLTDGCFASIMFQAVTALNFMHSHHLIHRDFKPSSLLIDVNGQVKLTNLGNLRKLAKTAAEAASVVGTTCYFAPERIIGVSFTNSADIWALGLTVLEAHTGSYPFKAQQHNYIELLEHIVQSPCPVDAVKESLSPELEEVLRRCLEKQAKDRPSAQDLLKTEFVLKGRDSACGVELGRVVRGLLGSTRRTDKGGPRG
jgi:mitogen-activated protein kinase kinase